MGRYNRKPAQWSRYHSVGTQTSPSLGESGGAKEDEQCDAYRTLSGRRTPSGELLRPPGQRPSVPASQRGGSGSTLGLTGGHDKTRLAFWQRGMVNVTGPVMAHVLRAASGPQCYVMGKRRGLHVKGLAGRC